MFWHFVMTQGIIPCWSTDSPQQGTQAQPQACDWQWLTYSGCWSRWRQCCTRLRPSCCNCRHWCLCLKTNTCSKQQCLFARWFGEIACQLSAFRCSWKRSMKTAAGLICELVYVQVDNNIKTQRTRTNLPAHRWVWIQPFIAESAANLAEEQHSLERDLQPCIVKKGCMLARGFQRWLIQTKHGQGKYWSQLTLQKQ